MTDFRDLRGPLLRSKSATHSPVLAFCSGDVPPELSPLDELAKQGRLLKRQLEGKSGLTLTPQSVHKSLRRPSPGARSPLERSFSLDSQGQQGADRRLQGFGIQFPAPGDDRPTSSYPHLSTIPSESSNSRDSTMSNYTNGRESSTSNMTSAPLANLYNNSDYHGPIKEFDFNARNSVEPSIENVLFEEPECSPTRLHPESGFDKVESLGNHDRKLEAPTPMPPIRHDSGHEVPPSERIPNQTESVSPAVSKQKAPAPSTKTIGVVSSNLTNQSEQKSQYQAFSYARLAATRKNSSGGDKFGPPSRQNSNEQDKSGLPTRQNIYERSEIHSRANSNERRRLGPPSQQNSNERDRYHPSTRQNAVDPERQRPHLPTLKTRNARESTTSDTVGSAASPISPMISRGSPTAFGPTSTQMIRQNSQDNSSPIQRYPRSTGPSTPRPPSAGSDKSLHNQTSRAPSRGINFSRPIIPSSPSVDTSSDNQDHVRATSNATPNNGRFTPMGFDCLTGEDDIALVTSDYTYSTYQLPRGRDLPRNSIIFLGAPDLNQEPSRQSEQQGNMSSALPARSTSTQPISPVPLTKSSNSTSARQSDSVSSILRQTNPLAKSPALATPGGKTPSPNPSPDFRSGNLQAARTPRPQPSKDSLVASASLSAEEHVNLGIECHEKGSLQESSYHLRCAANAGHPTGMLLYALALRHGWGMRPNPKEGVAWLKKVTQLAGGEVADAETTNSTMDLIERKGRKAQFALSIYELGVSHLNGWGTEQDKSLALQCFEIAGKWGDSDALAEAGFCYANGVGCKKDLKKSARFYRMAEAKGVNMVGNSWIWKDKYLDEGEKRAKAKREGKPDPTEKEKHSHGGGFFHRKKNTAAHN